MTTFLKFWNRIFLVFIYLFSWTLFTLFHLQDLAWIKLHFCFPIGLILAQPAVGGKHVIWPMDWNYDLNTVQEPTSTHAFIGVTNHHATDLEAKYTETNGWQLNSHNFILVWKHYSSNVIINIGLWSTFHAGQQKQILFVLRGTTKDSASLCVTLAGKLPCCFRFYLLDLHKDPLSLITITIENSAVKYTTSSLRQHTYNQPATK